MKNTIRTWLLLFPLFGHFQANGDLQLQDIEKKAKSGNKFYCYALAYLYMPSFFFEEESKKIVFNEIKDYCIKDKLDYNGFLFYNEIEMIFSPLDTKLLEIKQFFFRELDLSEFDRPTANLDKSIFWLNKSDYLHQKQGIYFDDFLKVSDFIENRYIEKFIFLYYLLLDAKYVSEFNENWNKGVKWLSSHDFGHSNSIIQLKKYLNKDYVSNLSY